MSFFIPCGKPYRGRAWYLSRNRLSQIIHQSSTHIKVPLLSHTRHVHSACTLYIKLVHGIHSPVREVALGGLLTQSPLILYPFAQCSTQQVLKQTNLDSLRSTTPCQATYSWISSYHFPSLMHGHHEWTRVTSLCSPRVYRTCRSWLRGLTSCLCRQY